MMVGKIVYSNYIQNCLSVLLLSSLTLAIESDINCLRSLKSQLKDPKGHLSSWVFGNNTQGSRSSFGGVTWWGEGYSRVSSIYLDGLGLEGEFPSGLKECSSLTSLTLTGNKLNGTLPSYIFSFLPYLVTLNLSNNSFSGEIPASFSFMAYLNFLLLDHNQFTGQIPPGLASLSRLKLFSVAHNHLKGPIPEFTNGPNLSSFQGNQGLCGFPLDPCPLDPSSDSVFSMAIITAACAAAVFFPVGAAIGWFLLGNEPEQRPRRHQKPKPDPIK